MTKKDLNKKFEQYKKQKKNTNNNQKSNNTTNSKKKKTSKIKTKSTNIKHKPLPKSQNSIPKTQKTDNVALTKKFEEYKEKKEIGLINKKKPGIISRLLKKKENTDSILKKIKVDETKKSPKNKSLIKTKLKDKLKKANQKENDIDEIIDKAKESISTLSQTREKIQLIKEGKKLDKNNLNNDLKNINNQDMNDNSTNNQITNNKTNNLNKNDEQKSNSSITDLKSSSDNVSEKLTQYKSLRDTLNKNKKLNSDELENENKDQKSKPKIGFLNLFMKNKKKEKIDVEEKDIRILFKKKNKEKKQKLTAAERKRRLSDYIEKAGLNFSKETISKRIFQITIVVTTLLTILYVYLNVKNYTSVLGIYLQVLILWIFGFLMIWGGLWIVFRIYLDLLMFRRKLDVEEVLPDFLQLTSANLRAGMPIDRALWFAVRPRFGVLAREIEDVAKRTLAGEDLHHALLNFAHKYDSSILQRSVYLLNEGMEAGGDVGDLLNKIALNIQEMRGMKKEMAANVTTYVIFISFAAMICAPALFGLSGQLLEIVQKIATDVAASGGSPSGGGGLTINISDDAIKIADYKTFSYVCLAISSMFSGIIVSTIKKGNIREGLQYIPIFMFVSMIVYFIASLILGAFMGGMF